MDETAAEFAPGFSSSAHLRHRGAFVPISSDGCAPRIFKQAGFTLAGRDVLAGDASPT